jgi:repressor LexA
VPAVDEEDFHELKVLLEARPTTHDFDRVLSNCSTPKATVDLPCEKLTTRAPFRVMFGRICSPSFRTQFEKKLQMMPTATLTPRQSEIFDFLKERILVRGYGPTIREIGNQFGIASPNGVMCHLKALEKKGLIIREPNMARAIQLANQPISRSALASVGRLTEANPLDVLDKGEQLDFAPLFEDSENFAVTATGDALAGVHVADGDTVVLTRTKVARNGDIVLALVDDASAVLRIYHKAANQVSLQASGKTKPITSKNIQILGKAVAVIRKL